MTGLLSVAVLLLALGFCRGHRLDLSPGDELELETRFPADAPQGSLWPLPQKVQTSEALFKLSGSTFAIVDAKRSSAGPSCALLQDAYTR